MIPPHELKNREFTKVLRGYSSVEVDEHIDFIIEKYTEIYRENDELERKLKLALAEVEALKTDEESIRSALVNAQRASANIIAEANERADLILRSAKNNCDKIIVDFRNKIKKERDTLYELRRTVDKFKTEIFTQYQQHITYLQEIAPDKDDSAEWEVTDDEYVKEAVRKVKTDVAAGAEKITAKLRAEEEMQTKAQAELEVPRVQDIIAKTAPTKIDPAPAPAPEKDPEPVIASIPAPIEEMPAKKSAAPVDDYDDEDFEDLEDEEFEDDFDENEVEIEETKAPRKSISVKDTIKELNRKFMSGSKKKDDDDDDFDDDEDYDEDEDEDMDDLLDLLDDEDDDED